MNVEDVNFLVKKYFFITPYNRMVDYIAVQNSRDCRAD